MQIITSRDNEQIKQIRKLKDKKYRDAMGVYVIEGIKTVNEAIREEADIQTVVICDDSNEQNELKQKMLYAVSKFDILYVNEPVFESISHVMHPQGILAVVKKKEQAKINYDENLIVILDDIQDPGNLGTIIRTVDSCKLSQIIISRDTADAYSPKVVRSTMSGIFRVNVIETQSVVDTIEDLKSHGFKIVSTTLESSKTIYDIDYNKTAIIIGNEANGISRNVLSKSDFRVKIPMKGKTESLNAAVATGIVLYEAMRQAR